MLLLTILVSSCLGCRIIDYDRLTEAQKQMIPYSHGESVNFIDSLGHPFVLTAKIGTSWHEPDDCFKSETRNVILQSEQGDWVISFYTEIWLGNQIIIGIRQFYSYINYDDNGRLVAENDQYLHNSLEIDNNTFYDVLEGNVSKNGRGEQYYYRFFYNKKYGILQLVDNEKVIFTIDKTKINN